MGIEGPERNSALMPDPEVPNASRGVTRRDFLKGLGVALLYPSALLAKEKSDLPKEVERSAAERTRVYERGLVEMRLEARMNPKEQQRLFIDNGPSRSGYRLRKDIRPGLGSLSTRLKRR